MADTCASCGGSGTLVRVTGREFSSGVKKDMMLHEECIHKHLYGDMPKTTTESMAMGQKP